MKNSNNKGYMLVEIILAFAITFALLYFMMDLVLKIKNKNDDLLVETIVKTDSTIITNKLMELAKNEEKLFNCNNLKIENKSIIYIDKDNKKNVLNILNDYVSTSEIKCTNKNNTINIKIPLKIKQLKNDIFDVNVKYVYGTSTVIPSLEKKESGITFKIFDYYENDSKSGINNNGVYNYFAFRNSNQNENQQNETTDSDGLLSVKVLPKLSDDGYPIFNCQKAEGCNNFSLGYLFGSDKNPLGNEPNGVIAYNPTNTLLQKNYTNGLYQYDSNKNAVDYDVENNKFEVKTYQERTYSTIKYENTQNIYNFLPFNYWDSDNIKEYNGKKYNYETEETNYWFGMTMQFDFYIPKDGILKNGENMIFSFTGDDDVWVFIDDILMLDLGGTHGAAEGQIDFATGKIFSRMNWNGTIEVKEETTISKRIENANSTINSKLKENEKHTLKFFYLERGAGVSNCKIEFNIEALK